MGSFSNLFRSHRYSPVEKLYLSQLKGSLRESMSNLCIGGIGKNMGSQVLIPLQAVQNGEEAGRFR